MALFAVLAPSEDETLVKELQRLFPGDHLKLGPGQWLISAPRTAKEISDALGISDARSGNGIVIAAGPYYYGRASSDVWAWINARLQSAP